MSTTRERERNKNVTPHKLPGAEQIHFNTQRTHVCVTGRRERERERAAVASLFECAKPASPINRPSWINQFFPPASAQLGTSPFALFNIELLDTRPPYPSRADMAGSFTDAHASFQYRVKPQLRENHWLPLRSQYPAFVVSPLQVETGRD